MLHKWVIFIHLFIWVSQSVWDAIARLGTGGSHSTHFCSYKLWRSEVKVSPSGLVAGDAASWIPDGCLLPESPRGLSSAHS